MPEHHGLPWQALGGMVPCPSAALVSAAPRARPQEESVCCGSYMGGGGKGEVQTPRHQFLPRQDQSPRAPVWQSAGHREGADRCLSHPPPLCFQACWEAKPPTRSSLGTGCLGHSAPCTSPDARQSGRSEESCQVKGRNTQRPGLGPTHCVPRWFPCSGAGWSLCCVPAPGPHAVQGPLGV